MAIYHFSLQIIGRGKGKSSVASAAYRAAEKIHDERTGLTHDYTRKKGVIYKEIITPTNAPKWAGDRTKLWNDVERFEKSKNSQLAREVDIALPVELPRKQQIDLAREYIKNEFVAKGMIADWALHDIGDGNPHFHAMLTMRTIDQSGTWGAKSKKEYMLNSKGEKIRLPSGEYKSVKVNATDWDSPETFARWRISWAEYANKALEKSGSKERIDHRSLAEQGMDRIPQIHLGPNVAAMEKKEKHTRRGDLYKEIADYNKTKIVELAEYKRLKKEIRKEKKKIDLPQPVTGSDKLLKYFIFGKRFNDKHFISELVKKGYIYEIDGNKMVYVHKDRYGNVKSVRSQHMTIADNPPEMLAGYKSFGFYLKGKSDRLIVFDDYFDMLRHAAATYKKSGAAGKDIYTQDHLIVAPKNSKWIVENMLKQNPDIKIIEYVKEPSIQPTLAIGRILKILTPGGRPPMPTAGGNRFKVALDEKEKAKNKDKDEIQKYLEK